MTVPPERPAITFEPGQLQRKFKHAADFGISEAYSLAASRDFERRLRAHIETHASRRVEGWLRGTPAVLHVDPASRLGVMLKTDGRFITAFRARTSSMRSSG